MSEPTKDQTAANATQMAAGVQKYFGSMPTMPLDGQTPTPAEVEAKLEGFATLRKNVDTTRAVYETALQAASASESAMIAYMATVARFVRATLGNAADILADFGIKPMKARTPLTADEQAAAVAKREATRQARHTMGTRQKAAIHGDVTGVVVTPIVSLPQASPEATPAQPAPAAAPEPRTTK